MVEPRAGQTREAVIRVPVVPRQPRCERHVIRPLECPVPARPVGLLVHDELLLSAGRERRRDRARGQPRRRRRSGRRRCARTPQRPHVDGLTGLVPESTPRQPHRRSFIRSTQRPPHFTVRALCAHLSSRPLLSPRWRKISRRPALFDAHTRNTRRPPLITGRGPCVHLSSLLPPRRHWWRRGWHWPRNSPR